MKMTVEALKDLYVKLGGLLTDTYSDIANGIPVAEYTLTPDCILACSKKASGGGGGADGGIDDAEGLHKYDAVEYIAYSK